MFSEADIIVRIRDGGLADDCDEAALLTGGDAVLSGAIVRVRLADPPVTLNG